MAVIGTAALRGRIALSGAPPGVAVCVRGRSEWVQAALSRRDEGGVLAGTFYQPFPHAGLRIVEVFLPRLVEA